MPPLATDGIVLRVVDYSETSQVPTFYTRDAGRLTGIAKGAKRAKTAFHGPFDLFGLYRIVYREKPPGQLHLLTAADLREPHAGLRSDPVRLIAASWCAELLLGLTADGAPTPALFELLAETLQHLQAPPRGARGAGGDGRGEGRGSGPEMHGDPPRSPAPPSRGPDARDWEVALFRFEAQALTHLGHRPRVSACALCGAAGERASDPSPGPPRAAHGGMLFSPHAGGAVCDRCARAEPAPLRVRLETLRLLQALAEPGAPAPEEPLGTPLRQELRAVLRSAYTYLLERAPVALGMLP